MTASAQVRRMLTLVPYLLAHPNAPLADVAAVFAISEKQLRSDLDILWFCGLPGLQYGDLIEVDISTAGGVEVVNLTNADYLARPLRFSVDEAVALIVAVRALADFAPPSELATIRAVLDKLNAVAGEVAGAADRAAVQIAAVEPDLRGRVETAVEQRRQLRLRYDSPTRPDPSERIVDPLRVRLEDGYSYLDAYCHSAEGLRNFRLDRISEAVLLDTPADEHPDLTLPEAGQSWLERFSGAPTVTLDLSPQAQWTLEYYPVQGEPSVTATTARAVFPVTSDDWLRTLLLRLGDAARVVVPADAGDSAARAAADALRHYDVAAAAPPEPGARSTATGEASS